MKAKQPTPVEYDDFIRLFFAWIEKRQQRNNEYILNRNFDGNRLLAKQAENEFINEIWTYIGDKTPTYIQNLVLK